MFRVEKPLGPSGSGGFSLSRAWSPTAGSQEQMLAPALVGAGASECYPRFGFGGRNVLIGLHAIPGVSSCGLARLIRTSCP
jgi:hypothetical protein